MATGFGSFKTVSEVDKKRQRTDTEGEPDAKAQRVGPARPSASVADDDSNFLSLLQRGTSERIKKPVAEPAPKPKELNPFWELNSTGLPQPEDEQHLAEQAASSSSEKKHQDFTYMDKCQWKAEDGKDGKGDHRKKKREIVDYAKEEGNYSVADLARDKRLEDTKGKFIDYKKMNASRLQGDCTLCMDGKLDRQHVIAFGNKTYLAVPGKGSLCAGHCLIVPVDHKICSRDFAADEQAEVRNFKKCLMQMFYSRKQKPVFIETVIRMKQFRHTSIECFPLSEEEFADASIAFYKEMDDAESEFRQSNKRVIKFKDQQFQSAIPPDFPYFAVEFGLDGGYVHLIAEENRWNPHFGRDVVGGLLGLATGGRTRHTQGMPTEEFVKMWQPYDWTVALGD
eukprot:TRINITY_DN44258_c0_g1_i1.p1 TRINITY_DN44258_c0_g1~~TRINITY_DN44258_c0_g1_i1.p1  ORF type:complete len:403 (-),score=87.59 TRINITY_DN44258_c0_g1_i1:8-1195(-)